MEKLLGTYIVGSNVFRALNFPEHIIEERVKNGSDKPDTGRMSCPIIYREPLANGL